MLLIGTVGWIGFAAQSRVFSRDELIEDVRQLAEILETTHPDPFLRGGGRVAFYLRLDAILNAIPDEGMTVDRFIRLLRPLVASVGDAHTAILSTYPVSDTYAGGVPLRFGVVETSLVVNGIASPKDERLFGARLVSVEGLTVPDLMARQRTIVGLENDYHVLLTLAERTLWYGPYLEELLPDWADPSRITVALDLPSGERETVTYELPTLTRFVRRPATAVDVPAVNSAGFFAGFLSLAPSTGAAGTDHSADPIAGGECAYVRIDHQAGFREFLEENAAAGANDTTAEQRARVPSATEAFRDLAIAMEARGTETLLIDLRFDVGGTDSMADILVYFLFGFDGLRAFHSEQYIHGGFSAMRYSVLHFKNCANRSIEQVNEGRDGVPLAVGEYDIDDYRGQEAEMQARIEQVDVRAALADDYETKPTFHEEFVTGAYAGFYRPTNVAVLVSPKTFSAGSTVMKALGLAGATLFGTPSGQSSNSFGNGTLWRLDHSGVNGIISRSYFDPYPNDPARGDVWPIDVPLTYEAWRSYESDPNAELLLALDWFAARGGAQ